MLKNFTNLNQKFFIDEVHYSGAIFGGQINTIKKIAELYYNKFDE